MNSGEDVLLLSCQLSGRTNARNLVTDFNVLQRECLIDALRELVLERLERRQQLLNATAALLEGLRQLLSNRRDDCVEKQRGGVVDLGRELRKTLTSALQVTINEALDDGDSDMSASSA